MSGEKIELKRDCEVILVPDGIKQMLGQGEIVTVAQELGESFTVYTEIGRMVRIDGKDADALGKEVVKTPGEKIEGELSSAEDVKRVSWDTLKTIYDPEIPVNVVDLGLIYDVSISKYPTGGFMIQVQMTLTAPGCGMGDVLRNDADVRLRAIPGVNEVDVQIVLEPPWDKEKMSEAAKLQLGMI